MIIEQSSRCTRWLEARRTRRRLRSCSTGWIWTVTAPSLRMSSSPSSNRIITCSMFYKEFPEHLGFRYNSSFCLYKSFQSISSKTHFHSAQDINYNSNIISIIIVKIFPLKDHKWGQGNKGLISAVSWRNTNYSYISELSAANFLHLSGFIAKSNRGFICFWKDWGGCQ